MQLIKIIEKRKTKKGDKEYIWGLFFCPYCERLVKKQKENGLKIKSCGCMRYTFVSEKLKQHGDRLETSAYYHLYRTWLAIKSRCYNPNNHAYERYGNSHISLCSEWKTSYICFKEWAIRNGYKRGLTIDRINGKKGYAPNNCRFVSYTINNRNRSSVKLSMEKARAIRIQWASGKFKQKEIAKVYNVSSTLINSVIHDRSWKENMN